MLWPRESRTGQSRIITPLGSHDPSREEPAELRCFFPLLEDLSLGSLELPLLLLLIFLRGEGETEAVIGQLGMACAVGTRCVSAALGCTLRGAAN